MYVCMGGRDGWGLIFPAGAVRCRQPHGKGGGRAGRVPRQDPARARAPCLRTATATSLLNWNITVVGYCNMGLLSVSVLVDPIFAGLYVEIRANFSFQFVHFLSYKLYHLT